MKAKILFFTILLNVGVYFINASTIPNISLTKVTPDGGVAFSQTLCIAEDELGFIWFGTNNGLFSYNSRSIQRHHHIEDDKNTIPSNRINTIYCDNAGTLWIATEKGLCSYNRKENNFKRYSIKDQFGNDIGNNINSFFQSKNNEYWFSDNKNVATFNPISFRAQIKNIDNKTNGISTLKIDKKGTIWSFFENGDIYILPNASNNFYYFTKAFPNAIRSVAVTKDLIWIAYETKGLLSINMQGEIKNHYKQNTLKSLSIPSNQARTILADNQGQIWLGTYNGIAIIKNDSVRTLITEENNFELPNHSVWSLFEDSQNNIWIGTWMGGLCFHSEFNKSFFHHTRSTPVNPLSDNIITSFTQIPEEANILIGTEGGSINNYDPSTNKMVHFPAYCDGKYIENIKALCYDKHGTLWVGTYGEGVLYLEKNSKTFKKLHTPFSKGLQAFALLATNKGLWVSSYNAGVYFYNFTTKTFTRYRNNPVDINTISDNHIRQIVEDKEGNLWFATQLGLNLLKKGSDQFIHFFHQPNNPQSISSNYIYSIHVDDKGFLWIGTNGLGIDKFDTKTHTVEHFLNTEELSVYDIFSIVEENNKLWLAHSNGLLEFNIKTLEVKAYSNHNGIKNNRFNPNAAIAASDNNIYIGGSNGMIHFSPENIKKNPIFPSAVITDFYIHNKVILPDTISNILEDVIAKTKFIKLKHWQNSLSFKFATNNFINPSQTIFKYRMLGFNDEWTQTNIHGLATFTNIHPGLFTLEVVAANSDGVWNKEPTQIQIRIIPPLWKRWYAYVLYYILLGLLILIFRKQTISRQKLKSEIQMSKIKSETAEQLHQMKLQFFTNISHEFRTPLTLIEGPVNRLLKGNNNNDETQKYLTLIKNNTQRLLRLINQFLDFRKIESSDLKLKPVNSDIVDFCRNLFSFFDEHAKQRDFSFVFKSDVESLNVDFDMDKFDKILFNILSNAFKYSSDSGDITMEIQNNKSIFTTNLDHNIKIGENISSDFVEISIKDTGKGIAQDKLERVFDRFYQIGDSTQLGTGIGLSLTKNYILLHKGQLIVQSNENKGSIFSIYIPQKQAGTINTVNPIENKLINQGAALVEPLTAGLNSESKTNDIPRNQEALILIVEDNTELLDYMKDVLQNHFRVAKARNGKEAYDQVFSLYPDLIISDIMMPEMDGIELCSKLKNDVRTSHIPIVLLTALDTIKDRIAGINSGADTYIPKPFNDELLIVQIDNLLELRKKLRESFSTEETSWEGKYNSFDLDKKLISNAIKLIESNLTATDFTIDSMASQLNLSRTHLHRKLKSLTNQSATEFIRSIRLKRAVELMKERKLKINEIGYAVGFNSHNYFSKSFKKQYGKVPSDFMKDNLDFS